jgi:hypothetical protein
MKQFFKRVLASIEKHYSAKAQEYIKTRGCI